MDCGSKPGNGSCLLLVLSFFSQQMAEYRKRLEKGKADEAMMLRALQEIRHKTLEDERHLNTAVQLVKVILSPKLPRYPFGTAACSHPVPR